MGASHVSRSTSSGLAIASLLLGTGVQLNGDVLDPVHGLVAVDAVRVVSDGRLELFEEKNHCQLAGDFSPSLVTQDNYIVITSFRQSCSGYSGFQSLHQ